MQVAGLCGIIAPIIAFSLITLAIQSSTSFSWDSNALSDLGVSGLSAVLFNSALIIAGILSLVFAYGISQILKSSAGQIGSALFYCTGLSLMAIGIFPETAGRIHFYVSVAFFTFAPLSLLVIGVSMIREKRKAAGILAVASATVAIIAWVPQYGGLAVPETIAAASMSLWSIMMGFSLIRIKSS